MFMLHNLHFFSSKCRLFHNTTLFGSCIIHILNTGCAKIKENSGAKELSIVWCLSQNIACSSAGLISVLFCSPTDMMGFESWTLWSYSLVLLLGVTCYFLYGWFRAVRFVMQLPGPPVVPLLGNALLISNHQSEIY
jgi:hypothetical protein